MSLTFFLLFYPETVRGIMLQAKFCPHDRADSVLYACRPGSIGMKSPTKTLNNCWVHYPELHITYYIFKQP